MMALEFHSYQTRHLRPPLTCDSIMLDVCLLRTSYHFLSVIPHGFHSGGASTARLEGKNILNIHSDGHWGEKSSAKAYLARVVVQTTGGSGHSHTTVLCTHFPTFFDQYFHLFPARYPGLVAAFKIQDQCHNRNSRNYLRL